MYNVLLTWAAIVVRRLPGNFRGVNCHRVSPHLNCRPPTNTKVGMYRSTPKENFMKQCLLMTVALLVVCVPSWSAIKSEPHW